MLLRFAIRQLIKTPGFAAIAVATLALGIGANTAIFSVVDRLLVRALPVPEPNRLVVLGQPQRSGSVDFEFNYPLFADFQRENTVFSELAATAGVDVGLGTGGSTTRQPALLVSGNYFRLLRLEPALGRTFGPDEGTTVDDANVVVLSHGCWRDRFGADPAVLGRTVTVNGQPFTVIGVTPREFAGTTRTVVPDLYLPITCYGQLDPAWPGGQHPLSTRYFVWHHILGRLRDGVTFAQAEAEMNRLAGRIHAVAPVNTPETLAVLPGMQGFTQELREARLPLRLLFAAAALVLLIACANLANLQLIRAVGRRRDLAIRLALGAGRGRVMGELLMESGLISLLGGGAGLLIAVALTRVLDGLRPPEAQLSLAGGVEPRMLVFTLVVAAGTALLTGLLPAWRASRPDLVPELKGVSESDTPGRRWGLRSGLVVLQISLSVVVLVGAGLCVRSLIQLQRVDAGFEPSRVVLTSLDLGLNKYGDTQAQAFYETLLERIRTLPGVESASVATSTPLGGRTPGTSLERVEGFEPEPGRRPVADYNLAAPDYFRTLGIPLLQGRDFSARDTAQSTPVVIVNEEFVRRYFPDQNVVGRRIVQHGPDGGIPTEVIGVVRTTQNRRLTDSPRPAIFFPVAQKPEQALARTVSIRTGVEARETQAQIRALVKALDPAVPVFGERTLAQQKLGSLALQRTAAWMLGGFGVLALLLAALGIYGVLAYSVSRRTREIGVRMALGAEMHDVLRLILRQGAGLVFAGLLVGVLAASGLVQGLRGFLFGVIPMDPLTFAGVILLLAVVGALACWIPARRAAQVDPLVALRQG